jgi:hypothetical protein
MPIVLPESPLIRAVKRRREGIFLNVNDLISYLYKAAADYEQEPIAASAFRMLAEELEDTDNLFRRR